MTESEKLMIKQYRQQGHGYKQIANLTGISVNTIKSYCKRNRVTEEKSRADSTCENCGKPINQNLHRKKKRFCSDKCRNAWWNSHLNLVNRKANYKITCPACMSIFSVYGNANRKYCSHKCYIEFRFGGASHE